ncbi:hypothetical protein IAD21_05227 [Abditibacteriota bacterium]|nr:hypothetical protein IAD21_05227 [Abditibacteriota bacterium]
MSSDNIPPLPQPTRYTCANCGFGWNEPSQFCPRCGAALVPIARQKASSITLVAYGCGFILLGGLGACFSLVGFGGGFEGTDWANPFSFIGVVLVAFALFLLWKMIRGGR